MRFGKFFGILLIVSSLTLVGGMFSAQAQSYSASYKFLKAIKKMNYRDIKIAIEKGVNVNARDYDDQTTPLIIAVKKKEAPLVKYLLASGAKPNLYGKDGKTPLVIAAGLGDKTLAALLIGAKADLDLADKNGTTPLIAAVLARKGQVVKLLLDAGADYTLEDYSGRSPLQHAKDNRRRRLVKILEEAGAS
ncbi:MAG: ankyrin repeat domain-containing protein [Alphaproteobacteria bacterium]|nr:ankyrin repeat domain-containing protein [Alphaproteobacteria bacterium]